MSVPGGPPGPGTSGEPREPAKGGLRSRIKPKHVLAFVVVVLFVVFMVENLRKVKIRFIGPEVHAPLILALLVSAVLGALVVLAIQRLRRRG
jgi:uncharacterized integral membrane protein